ncbi:FMN-binding glutamate synthase family protein [Lysobacteraceae bacterium NML07-0707]|nr:FMN-binding glutamate synthase family protein [Xanthomonadaceae bacterium NML07-0707]
MSRYLVYVISVVLSLVSLGLLLRGHAAAVWGLGVFGALAALGTWDLLQTRSTLRRLYPVMAHFRYGLESIGPEIRQYFIERDTEKVPFSREQRALVYQRAKSVSDVVPFGSKLDVYGNQYEWINHSLLPSAHHEADYRILIGGPQCRQPYQASIFNISAMSFGALSANAVRALNLGARRGGFAHDTGEGAIARYHREHGGDLIWEIGSGYFGCRDAQGRFDPERFARHAAEAQVKMIELKLSQGAKPGHGGMLPGSKVTAEIAETRGVPMGVDCISPATHSSFDSPVSLLEFVARLRELAESKPVGFKLAIGHPWEWFGIAKAMQETGILPDFIVIDGAEGGTGAAPSEFINHVGVPMHEGLHLVHNTLIGLNLRQHIRLGAAGQIVSAFDIARTLALGADWCNAARGFMLSLGCIQSLSCHNGRCPTGIATQDPRRWKKLDVEDKARRVQAFHDNTLQALRDLVCAAGLEHPSQLGPEHILRRVSPTEIRAYNALFNYLKPGELLRAETPKHAVFREYWPVASSRSFAPPAGSANLQLRVSL